MSRLLSQKMRPLSTHPLLCVYAKCGDILHTTSFNTLMGLSCYNNAACYQLPIYVFQCPHGLIPHFYVNKAFKLRIYKKLCQCPLGLIPHFYKAERGARYGLRIVSMPSRAYTSFLWYPFKNLGFMRFTEPVFAGICQNILTTAVFRAC